METMTWNKRYHILKEMLHTEEGRKQVVKELTKLMKTKDLSFGERKMLDQAQNWEAFIAEQKKYIIDMDEFKKRHNKNAEIITIIKESQ